MGRPRNTPRQTQDPRTPPQRRQRYVRQVRSLLNPTSIRRGNRGRGRVTPPPVPLPPIGACASLPFSPAPASPLFVSTDSLEIPLDFSPRSLSSDLMSASLSPPPSPLHTSSSSSPSSPSSRSTPSTPSSHSSSPFLDSAASSVFFTPFSTSSSSSHLNVLDSYKPDPHKFPSPVWKFFQKSNQFPDFAICSLCTEKNWVLYDGSTTPLRRHLEMVHHTVQPLVYRQQTYKNAISEKEQENLEASLAQFIIRDMRPFNIIEGSGFRDFLYDLRPGFKIPTRESLTATATTICMNLKSKLRSMMSKLDFLSLTADGWTSVANESFLIITGHWLTDTFEMKRCVLAAKHIEDRHTTLNLKTAVEDVLRDLEFKG